MSLAQRFRVELRKKLIEIGNPVIFRDYFVSAYWEELSNEELTSAKIEAAINYLLHSKD